MSTYYDMSISHYIYSEIEFCIITAIKESDGVWDTVDLVHLLDYWEELKEEASAKNSREIKRWLEQQKMFEKRNVDDVFLYHKIQHIINDNLDLNPEDEFHLVCDLAEMFENEIKDNEQED